MPSYRRLVIRGPKTGVANSSSQASSDVRSLQTIHPFALALYRNSYMEGCIPRVDKSRKRRANRVCRKRRKSVGVHRRGDRKYAQSSDATGDRSATLCIRRGKERMARMCSGPPPPGCPVEASPAPGVFVDSRRESKDRIGMPTPHPRPFCKRASKQSKTKKARTKQSNRRAKERAKQQGGKDAQRGTGT